MKKLIVMLGCLLIAPLAFAQPSSTDKETRNNYDGTGKRNRNDHQKDE